MKLDVGRLLAYPALTFLLDWALYGVTGVGRPSLLLYEGNAIGLLLVAWLHVRSRS